MERQQIIKGYAKNLELRFGNIQSDDAVQRWPLTLSYGDDPIGVVTMKKGGMDAVLEPELLKRMVIAPGVVTTPGSETIKDIVRITEWSLIDGQRYAAGATAAHDLKQDMANGAGDDNEFRRHYMGDWGPRE